MDQNDDPTTDRSVIERPTSRHGRSRRLVAVATGTTIALGGGGIAYAATTEPTPTPSTTTPSEVTPDEDHPEGDRPHGPGGGFVGAGGFGVLHGELVVETEDGTYETVATQRGAIDEITDDSVTVTSEDGYTATYILDAEALETAHHGLATDPADLAAGDEVMVLAKVDGATATVQRLVDLANLPVWPGPGGPRGEHPSDATPPDAGTETAPDTATS